VQKKEKKRKRGFQEPLRRRTTSTQVPRSSPSPSPIALALANRPRPRQSPSPSPIALALANRPRQSPIALVYRPRLSPSPSPSPIALANRRRPRPRQSPSRLLPITSFSLFLFFLHRLKNEQKNPHTHAHAREQVCKKKEKKRKRGFRSHYIAAPRGRGRGAGVAREIALSCGRCPERLARSGVSRSGFRVCRLRRGRDEGNCVIQFSRSGRGLVGRVGFVRWSGSNGPHVGTVYGAVVRERRGSPIIHRGRRCEQKFKRTPPSMRALFPP